MGKSGVNALGPKVTRKGIGSAGEVFPRAGDAHGSSGRVCRSCASWVDGTPHCWRMSWIERARHVTTGIGWASFRSNAATAATRKTPRKRIAFSIVFTPLLRLLRCCVIVWAGRCSWNIRRRRRAVPGFGRDLGMCDVPVPNEAFFALEWPRSDCDWRFGGGGYVGSRRNGGALYRVVGGKSASAKMSPLNPFRRPERAR